MPHYSKAPLTEAIIDLRVLPSGEDVVERLAAAFDGIFSFNSPIERIEQEFRMDGATEGRMSKAIVGYRMEDKVGGYVLQVTTEGFTLSKLPPYDRWETFRDRAFELWAIYRSVVGTAVYRTALRYIGYIECPENVAISHYVNLYPRVPSTLPGLDSGGYFLQLQLPQPDIESTLIINQSPLPSHPNDNASIALDFDLFRINPEWNPQNDAAVWEFLEVLRVRKNDVFEAVITDATRERIL